MRQNYLHYVQNFNFFIHKPMGNLLNEHVLQRTWTPTHVRHWSSILEYLKTA